MAPFEVPTLNGAGNIGTPFHQVARLGKQAVVEFSLAHAALRLQGEQSVENFMNEVSLFPMT